MARAQHGPAVSTDLTGALLPILSAHAASGHCVELGCPYCATAHRRATAIEALVAERFGPAPRTRKARRTT